MRARFLAIVVTIAAAPTFMLAQTMGVHVETDEIYKSPGSTSTDIFAADTSTGYTLVRVESAVEGRQASFSGKIVGENGKFSIGLTDRTTPFEERFVAADLVGLFRNLDPEIGMIVSLELVTDGERTSWLTAEWNFAMVMRRGDEIMTTGL